ncbi:MAG: cyclic nucleotide-binding domain-containing protein [Solirubrobacteraceae bacterium]
MDAARLTRNPVFAQLQPQELSRLAALATEESYAVGTKLVRQGDFSTELYVIEEGTAEVLRDGQEVDQVGAGDVIGEIGVLEKTRRNADIVVTAPMLAIKVTDWEVRRLSRETRAKLEAIAAERTGCNRPAPGPVSD